MCAGTRVRHTSFFAPVCFLPGFSYLCGNEIRNRHETHTLRPGGSARHRIDAGSGARRPATPPQAIQLRRQTLRRSRPDSPRRRKHPSLPRPLPNRRPVRLCRHDGESSHRSDLELRHGFRGGLRRRGARQGGETEIRADRPHGKGGHSVRMGRRLPPLGQPGAVAAGPRHRPLLRLCRHDGPHRPAGALPVRPHLFGRADRHRQGELDRALRGV